MAWNWDVSLLPAFTVWTMPGTAGKAKTNVAHLLGLDPFP
jgi:hypothetical protein